MRTKRMLQAVLLSGALFSGGLAATAFAQTDHASHQPEQVDTDQSLADQLTELRAMMVRLEAALEQNHRGSKMKSDMPSHQKGMDKPMGMDGMKMGDMQSMKKMKGMSSGGMDMGMKSDASSGMSMMGMMKGKGMMGGSQSATAKSSLPGFPGASNIYHIGAASFFLDHDEHIELTTEQRAAINKIKQQSELSQNTADRKIEEAEQQLWELTASDQPDATKIEKKVREIESLRGDRRMDFIRKVGEAAKVLTDSQRKTLMGEQPAADADTDATHEH
ncbi:MAG: Spy/CpxP family protein refolding chaperone [Phycisphaeraceae bacterium]